MFRYLEAWIELKELRGPKEGQHINDNYCLVVFKALPKLECFSWQEFYLKFGNLFSLIRTFHRRNSWLGKKWPNLMCFILGVSLKLTRDEYHKFATFLTKYVCLNL